jgi:hypothetical protein
VWCVVWCGVVWVRVRARVRVRVWRHGWVAPRYTTVAGVNVFALAPRQLHVIHVARHLEPVRRRWTSHAVDGRIVGVIGRGMYKSCILQ